MKRTPLERKLLKAVRWALGYGKTFPARPDGGGGYWWRSELWKRAGLDKDGQSKAPRTTPKATRKGGKP